MHSPSDIRELRKAISDWANARGQGLRLAGGNGGYSFIQLHTRPDLSEPERQLTFRAEIVDGHAVIRIPELETSRTESLASPALAESTTRTTVAWHADTASGLEPNAVCEGCGVTGTVGRAVRTSPNDDRREVHKFCVTCWPEQSARYRARWKEENRLWSEDFHRHRTAARGAGPGTSFVSATWHGTLELIEMIESSMIAPVPPTKEDLARIAAEIEKHAAERVGEMPYRVESFIRRHRGSKE